MDDLKESGVYSLPGTRQKVEEGHGNGKQAIDN
jgi:hypothetical protein